MFAFDDVIIIHSDTIGQTYPVITSRHDIITQVHRLYRTFKQCNGTKRVSIRHKLWQKSFWATARQTWHINQFPGVPLLAMFPDLRHFKWIPWVTHGHGFNIKMAAYQYGWAIITHFYVDVGVKYTDPFCDITHPISGKIKTFIIYTSTFFSQFQSLFDRAHWVFCSSICIKDIFYWKRQMAAISGATVLAPSGQPLEDKTSLADIYANEL